ncbi:MAG: type VI secretion system baseplate subunit TssK [Planctomycetota bacterium]
MNHEAVAWREGMFLRPHHLQSMERHLAEAAAMNVSLDHGYCYGLRRIEFSQEAIANGQFELSRCEARMRDGTLVSIDPGDEPDRVQVSQSPSAASRDLSAALDQDEVIDVLLAVPKLGLGRSNLGAPGDDNRFVSQTRTVADENDGGNDQEVPHRVLNIRLMLGHENTAGFETLPIARIRRSGASESAPCIDPSFIPPVLACDAWPELARDYVRAAYDILGQKLELVSAQVVSRRILDIAPEAGDLKRVLMLSALNGAFATLRPLAFASGLHPLVAYIELCRIVGSLSLFQPERRPGEIPTYDHENLREIFYWAREEIRRLISEVDEYRYERRDFIGAGRGMEVSLDPQWLTGDWKWYIGVEHMQMAESQCRELLQPGRLDWKLGSRERIDFIFKFSVPGLEKQLEETERDRALPKSGRWLFYRLRREGTAWQDLSDSEQPTLAMRFQESLITNLNELENQKSLIIRADDIAGELKFSLFAVPPGT